MGNFSLKQSTTGYGNSAFGGGALTFNVSGNSNVAIGSSSMYHNTTGKYNTSCGSSSMWSNSSGNSNSAFGNGALSYNTTAHSNVAIGVASLKKNTTRSNLVAIGDSALFNNGVGATQNSQGTSNTAVGSKSSYSNTTGHDNTSVGYESLYSNTTGFRNTSLGMKALTDNTEGAENTAIGVWALANNTIGSSNCALGQEASGFNTTGNSNTSVGLWAGRINSTGNYNVSVGTQSVYHNSTGSNNTGIGYMAGYGSNGYNISGCVFLGYEAGKNNTDNNKLYIDNSDDSTPLIGGDFDTDRVDINGTIKIVDGSEGNGKVLTSDADGLASWETKTYGATELNGLSDAITDGSSLFLGNGVGVNDDGANNNTAVGSQSLNQNTTGSLNSAFGASALVNNTTGNDNTAIGVSSLYSNTSGNLNTGIGKWVMNYNITGMRNTAVGYRAGSGISGNSISGCVFFGYEAGKDNTDDNKLFIDNSGTGTPLIGGDFSTDQVDINGTIKIIDGSEGNGKVLTSDADGLASWETPTTYASALNDLSDAITSNYSVFIGANAGINDEGGLSNNAALGISTLHDNTSGQSNSAFGNNSLGNNTTGNHNTSIGLQSLYQNITGSNNTAIGYKAGAGAIAHSISGCVFIGNEAGKDNTDDNKLFIDNSSTTTPLIGGDFNTDELYFNAVKVGIGTDDPNEMLEVAGTSGASARMNISDGGGSDRYAILFVSPNATDDFARIDSYKYGTSSGGKVLKINTAGTGGDVIIGGNVLPKTDKGMDLGASGTAWNNVYAVDFANVAAAAFANINVTEQLLSFPPQEKKAGASGEFTDKGLKVLNPTSLPKELTEDNALLIDEMTTYNYKANYEQQQQIETLKNENAELKARLEKVEKLMEGLR